MMPAPTPPVPVDWAGCYELTLGEWSPAPSAGNLRFHTPPRRIVLHTATLRTGRGGVGMNVLRPVIEGTAAGPYDAEAFWQEVGSDSAMLVWTNSFSGTLIRVMRTSDGFTGSARATMDVIPPPGQTWPAASASGVELEAADCAPSDSSASSGEAGDVTAAAADSVVLERTLCHGLCPAYRVRVSRSGSVHFTSRNPQDSGSVGVATIGAAAAVRLLEHAERLGLEQLPPDLSFCRIIRSDAPSAIISLYSATGRERVRDYRGCQVQNDTSSTRVLRRVRAFASAVDSIAGTRRWVEWAER